MEGTNKKIFVLVGPSGSGKTTLGNMVFPALGISELVSHTTRAPRVGEVNGEAYHFVSEEEFRGLDLIESTCYAGNYYGLSRAEVESRLNSGSVYAITDRVGASALKEAFGAAVVLFFVSVDPEVVKDRMIARGDKIEDVNKRIAHAAEGNEFQAPENTDFVVKNANLEDAALDLNHLVRGVLSQKSDIGQLVSGVSRDYIIKMVNQQGKKIFIVSHRDCDGYSAVVLANLSYGYNMRWKCANYNDVNQIVMERLENPECGILFITDISVNDVTAAEIQKVIDSGEKKVVLIDHHQTAAWLNEYDWAFVREGEKCGTELYYEWLTQNGFLEKTAALDEFSSLVGCYDTWKWAEDPESAFSIRSVDLNTLTMKIGALEYVKSMVSKLKGAKDRFAFSEVEETILKLENAAKDFYIKVRNERLIVRDWEGHQTGILCAENYTSDLAYALMLLHPEIDILLIINAPNKVSIRTVKDNIDVGAIAAKYYGGGHPKAAGFEMHPSEWAKFFPPLESKVTE